MQTLVSIFNSSIVKFSNKTALKIRSAWRLKSWTYRQVANYASEIAAILEQYNVGFQERVIIVSPNIPQWIGAYFGILQKGVIVVPLNPQCSDDFLDRIIDTTKAQIVFKHSYVFSNKKFDIPVFNIDQLDIDINKTTDFDLVNVKEDDLAEIVYTSGTTGVPKGVMLTHKNIVSNVNAISDIFKLSSKDRTVSVLPLFHMYEQTCSMLMGLLHGASGMFATSLGSSDIQRVMQDQRPTKFLVVPEFLETILRKIESVAASSGKRKILDFMFKISSSLPYFMRRIIFRKVHNMMGGKLRMIVSGGAYLHPEVERKWNAMGFVILQGYGLTETSPVISTNTLKDRRKGSVGKVISGTRVILGDNNEILVEGPNVFRGYYKNKEETERAFDDQGRFKTGDIGSFDKKGFLYITGRKKYMIVTSAGENIYPEDIEKEFRDYSSIKDIAVLGLPLEGREIVYAVFLTDLSHEEMQVIVEQVNSKLEKYQRIIDWSVWPEADFPRSATRKVKKNDVLEWIEKHKNKEDESVSKLTRQKNKLINLLASVSGKNASTIDDSTKLVADLHFDSLMRIEFVSRVEEELGVAIDENKLTLEITVAKLKELIEQAPKKSLNHRNIKKWIFSKPANFFRGLIRRVILFPIGRYFFNINIEGLENLKNLDEPAIFMANHISYIDPFVIVKALPSKIRSKIAIAAALDVLYEEYHYIAWLVEFLMLSYALPRKEGVNIRPGLERTGQILDKGYSVLVFPEGKVSLDGELQELKKGAGLFATEMMAPVVPVIVHGTRDLTPQYKVFPLKRGRVTVKFGKPIKFAPGIKYEDAVDTIYKSMKVLED